MVRQPQLVRAGHLNEGDMKSSRFTTRIIDEEGTTLILQSGQVVPNIWVPPWIGPAIIAAGTRRQWQEIRTEILRRKTPPVNATMPRNGAQVTAPETNDRGFRP